MPPVTRTLITRWQHHVILLCGILFCDLPQKSQKHYLHAPVCFLWLSVVNLDVVPTTATTNQQTSRRPPILSTSRMQLGLPQTLTCIYFFFYPFPLITPSLSTPLEYIKTILCFRMLGTEWGPPGRGGGGGGALSY